MSLVLVSAAVFLTTTGRFHGWLRTVAVDQVNSVVNGRVEIDALSGSLLKGLTVHGLRVSTGGQLVFTAEAIELGYSLWPIVRRNYVFNDLRISRPHVWLTQSASGWNVSSLVKPSAEPGKSTVWKVAFQRVTIDQGTVSLTLQGRQPVELQRLDLEGGVVLGSGGSSVDIRRGAFREAATSLDVTMAGRLAINGAGVSLDGVRLSAPGVTAAANLRISEGRLHELAARVTLSNLNPSAFSPYVPVTLERVGALAGEISASGPLSALDTTWNLTSTTVGASNGQMAVDVSKADVIGLRGDYAIRAVDPAVVTGRRDYRGRIDADGSVNARLNLGALVDSSGTLTVRSAGTLVGPYRADRLDAKAEIADRRLRVNARVASYRATLSTVASLRLADDRVASLSATGTLQNLDLRNVPAQISPRPFSTNVSGHYSFNWSNKAWSADFTASPSSIEAITIAESSTIHAEGAGAAVRVAAHADLTSIPAALLRVPNDLASSLQGSVDAELSIPQIGRARDLSALSGSAAISFVESDPKSLNPSQGTVSGTFSGGIANLHTLDVKSPMGSLSASGRLAFANDMGQESDIMFDADVPDLGRLSSVGLQSARGAFRTTGRLTGPAGAWRVAGKFGGQELAYGDRFQALTLNGEMNLVVPFDWKSTSGTTSVDGSFLVVAGNEISKATLTANRQERRLDLRGRLEQPKRAVEFDSGLELYTDYQELRLREMTVAGAGSPWRLAGEEDTVIRYSPRELAINRMTFARDAERLDVFGRLALGDAAGESAAEKAELAVDVTSVNVADLATLAVGEARVTGTANGRIRVRGVGDNGTASAELSLVEGRVANAPFQSVRLNGELARGLVDLTAKVIEPAGAVLDVSGRVPIRTDAGEADLRASGQGISLGLIEAATTAVNKVEGQAAIDLRATGPLESLSVNGIARIDAGAFTVAATGVRYQNINAGLRFDNDWAYVDTGTVMDTSGGILTLTGRTGIRTVDGARRVDLAVQSERIRVLDNQLGEVDLEADLRIAGRITAPEVTGRLVANSARVEIDEMIRQFDAPRPLPAAVPEAADAGKAVAVEAAAPVTKDPADAERGSPPAPTSAATSTSPAASASTGWPGARVDVSVELPDNVVMRARNLRTGAGSMGLGALNLTVGGTLTLRKAPDEAVVLVGAVEVVRGFYDFQGRRFDVTRGSALDFRGGEPSNPALNVTGEREVSGVTARVQVSGTARQPVLALSSQPSLSESDILALIVFNQPLSQLGTGEQVDLLERASDVALGAVASTLTDSIGRSLDVDLFEIRAPSAERPGEVAVSTQVSQRVFVGFKQQFGSSDASRLSIEYRLAEALRLVTSVGQGGRDDGRRTDAARLDLVYTIKY